MVLKVLPVKIFGPTGELINSFALLDEGSALTLLDFDTAKILKAHGEKNPLSMAGVRALTTTDKTSELNRIRVAGVNGEQHDLKNVRTVKPLSHSMQTLTNREIALAQYAVGL